MNLPLSQQRHQVGFLLGLVLAARPGYAGDLWDIDDTNIGFSIADAAWTISEDFPGTKLIIDGAYLFNREEVPIPTRGSCDCVPAGSRDRILGSIWGHAQWGNGETKLEYGRVAFSGLSYQTDFELTDEPFQPRTDTIEWGVLRLSKDDPLGINAYAEATIVETARIWRYKWSQSSPWHIDVGVNLSVGYAWADSTNDTYDEVSNPVIGTWWRTALGHQRWGRFYLEQRIINGFSFSSPARGGSVSREAFARFGFVHSLDGCLDIEIYNEKRSFNFSDPDLDDLYTKSRRTGIAVSCRL